MIDKLNEICDRFIALDKDSDKYILIKKILESENAFLNMDIETSYSILRDLNIPEENLKEVYIKLIDSNNIK